MHVRQSNIPSIYFLLKIKIWDFRQGWGPREHFLKNFCLYHVNNMDRLHELLLLAKDHGFMTYSSNRVMEISPALATFALVVQGSTIITVSVKVATIIPGENVEVEQLTTEVADFSVHDPSLSLSLIKRN